MMTVCPIREKSLGVSRTMRPVTQTAEVEVKRASMKRSDLPGGAENRHVAPLALPLHVVIPEFVPRHWWGHFLHNQTALLIKAALLFRPGKVSVSVPYHLDV
jgi:hypothetical protein